MIAATGLGLTAGSARAADDLTLMEIRLDRPTMHALGVQALIADDDDRDATIEVRVRPRGGAWTDAPRLFRVLPETVALEVPEQFAGSIFDLEPGMAYEIELHVVDPDGFDQTETVTAMTRPIPPSEPANPNLVEVSDASILQSALTGASPGDVIELAPGTYLGPFSIQASGTAEDPIVIRGADPDAVVLDGKGCSCNILEVYGSFVHVESLTLTGAVRAMRFLGDGAEGNVARGLTITDVQHGIGSQAGQSDFYICDNTVHGRLSWPWVFQDDATSHWGDEGIRVDGDGHVICHNEVVGFGDPILNFALGFRSWDVYGNDVYDCFDGIEIDRAAGNARVYRNRWTNVDSAISIQPVHGGPAYVLRNELHNVVSEQIKLKGTNGEPSGALVYHNTFVSPGRALNLQTPITGHNFVIANNLFVGPTDLNGNRTVEWTAGVNQGSFDFNGYYPDGGFWFGSVDGQNQLYGSFAEVMTSGEVEANGVLLQTPIFVDGGLVGPVDGTLTQQPVELDLDPSSAAMNAGQLIPGVNGNFVGEGPDLGAREEGCATPSFGPRAPEDRGAVSPVDCAPVDDGGGGTGGDDGGSSGGDGQDSGDAGTSGGGPGGSGTGSDGDTEGSTVSGATGSSDEGGSADGCGCRSAPRSSAAATLLALLGLLGLGRAPRRR